MLTDTSDWVGKSLCAERYRVLRKLGEGGMAHVYLASDANLDRDVVVKVPRGNLVHDASFAGRFSREVKSLIKLAHPHIVRLIDIGEFDGVPFAVMLFLTGGSLRDRQPRRDGGQRAPMPVSELASWLPAMAQALDFVHKHKYIHRDVKPENILFDEHGEAFLADLGIIKALAEPQDSGQQTAFTQTGMALGTPQESERWQGEFQRTQVRIESARAVWNADGCPERRWTPDAEIEPVKSINNGVHRPSFADFAASGEVNIARHRTPSPSPP